MTGTPPEPRVEKSSDPLDLIGEIHDRCRPAALAFNKWCDEPWSTRANAFMQDHAATLLDALTDLEELAESLIEPKPEPDKSPESPSSEGDLFEAIRKGIGWVERIEEMWAVPEHQVKAPAATQALNRLEKLYSDLKK